MTALAIGANSDHATSAPTESRIAASPMRPGPEISAGWASRSVETKSAILFHPWTTPHSIAEHREFRRLGRGRGQPWREILGELMSATVELNRAAGQHH